MTEDGKATERVTFSRGYDVCIMAIDGTWRRDCQLNSISDTDAVLTVEGSIQGLNLKEFFLLLSSTGLAYRRCELVRRLRSYCAADSPQRSADRTAARFEQVSLIRTCVLGRRNRGFQLLERCLRVR